ncbi:MAG: GNAT family N-acetyltransferase [Phycisphaerales bacterium]|nr:GNAT family N-acetyltransferase [Planctomycetota bacterium]MBL6997080.1 GNAT family N-acetyltransferase [Phycisphaerales bacterium]
MIVQKNRHEEAAIAILGNKRHARALLDTLQTRNSSTFHFVAQSSRKIDRAILFIHNAGATTSCLVTPPKKHEEVKRISTLIQEGLETLKGRNVQLAQTIMANNEPLLAEAYSHAGFDKLAILTYMERAKTAQTYNSTHALLTFTPSTNVSDSQIQSALLETYVDSLDCPKIHGLRKIEDIVAGHRGQGIHDAQLWTVAELGTTLAGILLLNPVPEADCMELAYLGCTPFARGKSVSDALVKLAIEQSAAYGLPRITLAVDSTNSPALGLYKRWNFHPTRKRLTMIQKLY